LQKRRRCYVYINNRLEGCAPRSIEAALAAIAKELAENRRIQSRYAFSGRKRQCLKRRRRRTSSRSFGLRVSLLSGTRDAMYSDFAESLREVIRIGRKSANDIRFDMRNSLSPTSC
jgi:hypothetical protein